jgi:hypothetical protein
MKKKLPAFCFIIFGLAIYSCCVVAKKEKTLFEVDDAYYQSWMVNENEKGTDISIVLSNVQPGVMFDSIVFRNNRLPVISSANGKTMVLTSILNIGIERISMEKISVNQPDQLMYRNNGKKYSFEIKSFKRKETKYLK